MRIWDPCIRFSGTQWALALSVFHGTDCSLPEVRPSNEHHFSPPPDSHPCLFSSHLIIEETKLPLVLQQLLFCAVLLKKKRKLNESEDISPLWILVGYNSYKHNDKSKASSEKQNKIGSLCLPFMAPILSFLNDQELFLQFWSGRSSFLTTCSRPTLQCCHKLARFWRLLSSPCRWSADQAMQIKSQKAEKQLDGWHFEEPHPLWTLLRGCWNTMLRLPATQVQNKHIRIQLLCKEKSFVRRICGLGAWQKQKLAGDSPRGPAQRLAE